MAEKTIKTKILLRYDVLSAWAAANPELKAGEVAIVAIPTDSKELNINGTTPPQILFKVGPGKFNDLPYASGKAADVYSWAKEASLSIEKVGEGNVVSGIEWDATANSGKGGIKFTTASVATSESLEDVQGRLAKLEAEIGDAANDYATSRIDALEKTISDNSAAWAKDDNTTYSFAEIEGGKGFTVTPSVGEAKTFTFAYLTADEVASAIEAYGYQDAEDVKDIVEEYLKSYYTKTEIDNKGFLVASDIAGKADKSYVDEELAKKADASALDSYYTKTEIDNTVKGINDTINGIDSVVDGLVENMEAVYGDKGEISTIKGRLTEAEGKISTLEDHFGDNGRVTVAEGKISTAEGKISTLEGHFGTDGRVTVAEGKISTLEGHFAEGGRVTVAEGKISELEGKVGNLSGAFQFKGTKESIDQLPAASADNAGHVYVVGSKEYASDGSSWILLGDEGSYVLKTTYEAHLLAQETIDQGQSDKIKAIEDDIKANRESWASKTSVTDPTAGDGKITVDGVEMVVYDDSALAARVKSLEDNPYELPSDVVRDANYKHITVTETSVSDGTTTFNKYDDTALAGRVTTVEGKVKTLEETTVPALDNRIKEVEKIKVTSTSVTDGTNTFTKYDDTALAGRVSEIEKDYLTSADEKALSDAIKAEKDRVDGLVNTTVPGINDRLDELEAKPDITVTSTSVSDGTNTFTKYDDTELAGRVKVVEDNFADWAIIWDCGGASNN